MGKPNIFFNNSKFSRRLLLFALLFGLVGGYILLRTFASPNPNLPGDLNNDNIVNISDLSILLSAYGTTNTNADINLDGTVNILDLSILLSHYGQSYSPPPPSSPWKGWTIPAVPSGATKVTSQSQLVTLLGTCSSGTFDATALTASLGGEVLIKARCSAVAPETIFLGPNVKFIGTTVDYLEAVHIAAAQNLTIYGGDVTNPLRGGGIYVFGDNGTAAVNVKWWGFYIHDIAQTGLTAFLTPGPIQGIDFRGEITNWGIVPALDPHNCKGSGQHGAYLGDNNTPVNTLSSSTFVLYIHDSAWGGGVQLGPNSFNNEYQVKAKNLTYITPSQCDGIGGNAIQAFGGNHTGIKITDIEADNVRRGVEASGLYGTDPACALSVTYGRVTNAWLSKYDTSDPGVCYTNAL